MSAQIESAADGLVTVKVSGKLSQPELESMQQEAAKYIQAWGSIRILIVADKFEGWERTGDWGELSFHAKHDQQIQRMAIVGEKRWEDLTLLFTAKGFRPFPIEFFQTAELTRAKAWLSEVQGSRRP